MKPNFTTTVNNFDYDFYIITNDNDEKLDLLEIENENLFFNGESVYMDGKIKTFSDIETLKKLNVPFDCINGLLNCYHFYVIKNEISDLPNESLTQNYS